MNIFGCCPKKPKMPLDYVIKWVEETDKTVKSLSEDIEYIKKMDLKPIFDEYAATYPWDQVPKFDAKADKVENSTEGNLAALNEEGNIIDSSYKASDFADANHSHNGINLGGNSKNHILIEEENLIGRFHVQLWDNQEEESAFSDYITAPMLLNTFYPAITPGQGNQKLITSGAVYTALQGKADSIHIHDNISSGDTSISINGDEGIISIEVTNSGSGGEIAITTDNIENLNRALETPDAQPVSGSDKLITSGAVYEALGGLSSMSIYTVNYSSVSSGNASISIANSTTVGTYNSFVNFISDNSSRIISIFLTKAGPNPLSCLATLIIGEEEIDEVSGNSSWTCSIIIGNMTYSCTVLDDSSSTSVFTLQS